MWVQPAMTSGSSLGRSKWKVVQQSLQFLLQKCPSNSTKTGVSYRIITRSFPTYLVATSEALPPILDHFRFLHEEFLEQIPAKKPKELVKNLKAFYLEFPDYQEPSGDGPELAEEVLTAKLNERIEKVLSTQCSPSRLVFYGDESDEGEDNEASTHPALRMHEDIIEPHKGHIIVNLAHEIERPGLNSPADSTYGSDNEGSGGKSQSDSRKVSRKQSEKSLKADTSDAKQKQDANANSIKAASAGVAPDGIAKHKEDIFASYLDFWRLGMRGVALASSLLSLPQGVQEIPEDSNVWTFPLKIHTFLNYPSLYMDDGITKKNSYQFLKEVQAVNTRRKNSTKINLTIAKSSVKSKVGLAKQWAGGLIHKSHKDAPLDDDVPKTAAKIAKKASLFFRGATNTSSNDLTSATEDSRPLRHTNTQSLTPPPKPSSRDFKLKRSASTDSITLVTHEKQNDGMKGLQVSAIKVETIKPASSRKLRTHSLIAPLKD